MLVRQHWACVGLCGVCVCVCVILSLEYFTVNVLSAVEDEISYKQNILYEVPYMETNPVQVFEWKKNGFVSE